MKKFVALLIVSMLCASASAGELFYEDFEDPGNLQVTLAPGFSVADGYLKGPSTYNQARNTSVLDGTYPPTGRPIKIEATFNHLDCADPWDSVKIVIGRDGDAATTDGLCIQWSPSIPPTYAGPYVQVQGITNNQWNGSEHYYTYPDGVGVGPDNFDENTDYVWTVIDYGDTVDVSVHEAADPCNIGIVTDIDISDYTRHGDYIGTSVYSECDIGIDDIRVRDLDKLVGRIDPCSISISEPSGSDTYTITLTEAIPAGADFRVYLDPCDLWANGLKQATVAPAKAGDPNTALDILFNASNWNTPVTVTVTAFNDAVGEAELELSLGHSLVQVSGAAVDPQTDPNWAFPGFANGSVSVAVGDDDQIMAVDIAPLNVSVAEQGPTSDTYTVVLKQPPTNPLTVNINNSSSDIGVSDTSLSFNAGDWNTPKTVTVTAVDDSVGEADPQAAVINHSVDPGGKSVTPLFSEDFDDLSLNGSLYGTATVSGGLLNGDYMGDGFIADFNDVVTDFEATLSFNFGGDTYSWNVVTFAYGSDGDADPCSYNGAPAGVMCWYLPNQQWMYILQQWDDGSPWSTIFLDQGCVLSGGYDPCDSYEFHINKLGDNLSTWVEEVGNPSNKTAVYNIDVSGTTLYGNRFYVSGDFTVGLGGVEAVSVGEVSYATQEQADWAAVSVDDVTVTITDNDCYAPRDTVVDDSDYDDDCDVDLEDFAVFASHYLDCLKPGGGTCP